MNSLFEYLVGDCFHPGYDRSKLWCEDDNQRYPQWLQDIIDYREKLPVRFHPAVKELADLIENNTRVKTQAYGMCDELVLRSALRPTQVAIKAIQSPADLLKLFNYILKVPPLWNDHLFVVGLAACPYWMLLNDYLTTECGFAFFLDPDVNAIVKKIMNAWSEFLASPASVSVLGEGPLDWFGPKSYPRLVAAGNLYNDNYSFEETYLCDPSKPHRGYRTWDDYFTRRFRPGVRPIAGFDDDSIIVHACEAMPFRVANNVQYKDRFWAKGGAYSLKDMLADDELSLQFAGGTVYQGFLSALTYHRWHSPVSGTIKRASIVPGTYFSQPLHKGFGLTTGGMVKKDEPNWEQPYIAATATRAVIFIQADNPDIGLMAVILIGMGEISTCEITVMEGQRLQKGDDLGTFHFGGSSHCIVFGPQVRLDRFPDPVSAVRNEPVNGVLARVVGSGRMEEPKAYAS